VQEISYHKLVQRLAECEILVETVKDRGVRTKAAQLGQGYRELLSLAACKHIASHRQ
jgi:hypothetical protein